MSRGKIIPILFLGLGIFLLIQISLPTLAYKVWELRNIQDDTPLTSPLKVTSNQVLGISVEQKQNFPALISSLKRQQPAPYQFFYLSIPTLDLSDSPVVVDSNDLSKGLVHLPGSALPGERGNVFISGHSSLPQFPTSKAIFANLVKVKNGDQINIKIGTGEFRYQVVGLRVVDPKDLSIIAPPDNTGRYITLMTCVPPGFNTKRLIVLGKLL